MHTAPHRIHIVWCHPRPASLTATVVQEVISEFEQHSVVIDELDLYRSGFSGDLLPPDEPDWDNPKKCYTSEVHKLAARAREVDAILFVFPVWWYSLPALLKGYIDRVWNYGLLYNNEVPHDIQTVRWIGLAGHSWAKLQKRRFDTMLEHNLNIGIAGYCGIANSRVTLLCDTLGEEVHDFSVLVEEFKMTARTVVRELVAELDSLFSSTHQQISAPR